MPVLGRVHWFFLCVATLSTLVSFSLTGPLPTSFKLGLLVPAITKAGSIDDGGLQTRAAFELAIRLINEDPTLLPGATLSVAYRDSQQDPGSAFFGALRLCLDEQIIGIAGAYTSGESKNAALVAREFKVPIMSHSSTSSALSDKETYSTFSRTVPPDGLQAAGLAWLGKYQYGWSRIGLLSDASGFGTDGAQDFQKAAKELGLEVVAPQVFDLGDSPSEIKPRLQNLLDKGARVILLFSNSETAGRAFLAARELNMLGRETGFVWLLSDGSMSSPAWTGAFASVLEHLHGSLGLKPRVDTANPHYENFMTEWAARAPGKDYPNVSWQRVIFDGTSYAPNAASRILYNEGGDLQGGTLMQYDSAGMTSIDSYAPFAVDVAYAYAHAIENVLSSKTEKVQRLTGANGEFLSEEARQEFSLLVLDSLREVDFEGITGRVTLNENLDRLMGYDVYNMVEGVQVPIAQWDPFDNYKSELQQITWPNNARGDENAPPDGPQYKTRYARRSANSTSYSFLAVGASQSAVQATANHETTHQLTLYPRFKMNDRLCYFHVGSTKKARK